MIFNLLINFTNNSVKKHPLKSDHQYSGYRGTTAYKENVTPSHHQDQIERSSKRSWSAVNNRPQRPVSHAKFGLQEDKLDRVLFPEDKDVMQRANQIVMYVSQFHSLIW